MANPYITCKEVQEITGVSQTKAYDIIRQLNAELKEQGYLTIRGKVSRKYFYKRYGIEGGATQ